MITSIISHIKSKIYDDGVQLQPQVISMRSVTPGELTEDLILNTFKTLARGNTGNIIPTNDLIKKLAPQLFVENL